MADSLVWMSTEDETGQLVQLLDTIASAEAERRSVTPALLAGAVGAPNERVVIDVDRLGELRLAWLRLEEAGWPVLTRAGRQYLARSGRVDPTALEFLAGTVDDLYTREALLRAGVTLVHRFQASVRAGRGLDHARALVPRAFEQALTESVALDLYAASVALMARLSAGAPAGCLAEEIIAVELMDEATAWIEAEMVSDRIDACAGNVAIEALRGLFKLFEDDDVLDLFEMREPGDAALAVHTVRNAHLGVVDQRLEAWFRPFTGTAPTGYLHVPSDEGPLDRRRCCSSADTVVETSGIALPIMSLACASVQCKGRASTVAATSCGCRGRPGVSHRPRRQRCGQASREPSQAAAFPV